MSHNQQNERKNIWYRPVTQSDYEAITQRGEVVTQLRILPGISEESNTIYEAFFSKDVSRSPYPNTLKWLVPVLVINDALHPEKNGMVGVMEVTKTVANQIHGKNTPPNYFDFQNGFNFNLVVSMQQSKDGNQFFPNYVKSHYEQMPKPVNPQYVVPKMKEGNFADFSKFVYRINNPQPKQNTNNYAPQAPQQYSPQPQPQPQPQNGNVSVGGYIQPTLPNTQTQGQSYNAPPAQPIPTPQQPAQPSNAMPWEVAETAPQPNNVPEDNISSEEFDDIFGTPNDSVPF